eukprot:TRINITY_DN1772_c0_g2_i1.p1 TRINITY_DN1772_c0_g2~~TRINITY_DN1772_c0_g2_i1.p1  ORF type:complete len:483 (-),score=96.88 TRINITY_DN1772_c0_g2_i1:86-1534(-)
MGRKKILIKKIENDKKRGITFTKRRSSVIKKAMELSILCDTKVAVVVIDGNQEAAVYSSADFDGIVQTVTIKRPPRILSNVDYDFLFPNGVDESSEASLNRLKSLMNNTALPIAPDAARQAMMASGSSSGAVKGESDDGPLAPGNTSLPKFSPTVLQNLQQQFLLHTAMQIGNPNAAQTTQQAIHALQLIQAMLPTATATPGVSSSSSSSSSSTAMDTTAGDATDPLLHSSSLGGGDISPASTMQAPSFSIPLQTPGISAQLAELHALLETNSNSASAAVTPSPTSSMPLVDAPSLSPSSNQTLSSSGTVAFAIPNAPVSRPAHSAQSAAPLPSAGLNFELNKDGSSDFSDVLNTSGTIGKRPSLSVSIPVENQYLPQLLALSSQRKAATTSSSSSSSSGGADLAAAPTAATAAAAAAAGAAAASAAVDQNKPLLTPGDFLMQQTPGWLPAPSPLGAPLMTPGLGSTPSSAPFNFPLFSPKQ